MEHGNIALKKITEERKEPKRKIKTKEPVLNVNEIVIG